MRRIYQLSSLLLLATFFLTGCEDEDTTSLAGTWQAFKIVLSGVSDSESEHPLPETWVEVLSLNPDGTFSSHSTQKGRTEAETGRWSYTPSNLILTQRGQDQIEYRMEGHTLVLSGNIPEAEFSLYWKKIN
jgi:uncharacterized lipoprotein NlpE involved in copper resistance